MAKASGGTGRGGGFRTGEIIAQASRPEAAIEVTRVTRGGYFGRLPFARPGQANYGAEFYIPRATSGLAAFARIPGTSVLRRA
jgi:hypothetical protein